MKNEIIEPKELTETVMTPAALLEHWQGHRRVTRRVIEAFPEDKLFNYSVGGMRPFAELVMEIITMTAPGLRGIITGEWRLISNAEREEQTPKTKEGLLQLWDEVTELINTRWSHIPPNRFLEIDVAFGQYKGPIHQTFFYFVDNEIHHRAQAYVYLRSLGIAPPPFWDRN